MKPFVLSVCASFVVFAGGTASASISAESIGAANYAGAHRIDAQGNRLPGERGGQVVFNNLQAGFTANAAFSSTDLGAVFGDRLTLTGTGTLQDFSFTLFNSASSAGELTSAVVEFSLLRGADGSSIGSFQVDTGAIALNTGFFTTLNVTGLGGLGINIDTTDLIVLQTVTSLTGAANRLGVVSANPISVGSSVPQLYIEASTVNGGVPGFYNITSAGVPISFNTGYTVAVPTPASAALLGLGGLAAARHRR